MQRCLSGITVLSLVFLLTNCSQVQSDNTNVEIIRGLYDPLQQGMYRLF